MSSGEPVLPGRPGRPTQPAHWSVDELIPFGKYILLNKISAGATAAVYRGKIRGEAGFERLVTIKRVLPQMAGDPDFVETFVREAKICARLTHGNICPIYELGKVGESLYMALEWVAGRDLGAITRRLTQRGKPMPPVAAAFVASRLCDALDYAHGLKDSAGRPLGILHQDLSPANIMITYEGEVKLIDFGIARASGRAQQTNVEALKQKIGYMSPELVLGTALDARSDVFGVGVVLYEMVTGKRLFAGSDDIATLKLVSSASVPPPSAMLEDTPEELEQIIMRALARDPDARWPSAGEMAHALMACIAAEDPTFGTRNIAEMMRELFKDDMVAEQRRLNELTAASQDAELMERRRRFFASPQGAAAVAKAEAARRLASARPPPPVATQPPPPPVASQPPPPPPARSAAQTAFSSPPGTAQAHGAQRDSDEGEDALTTYRESMARVPRAPAVPSVPTASRASAFGSPSSDTPAAGPSSVPVPGDALTAAATYDELIRNADASPDPEAEPTSFYEESAPGKAATADKAPAVQGALSQATPAQGTATQAAPKGAINPPAPRGALHPGTPAQATPAQATATQAAPQSALQPPAPKGALHRATPAQATPAQATATQAAAAQKPAAPAQRDSEEELTSFYTEPTVDERASRLALEEDADDSDAAELARAAESGEDSTTFRPERMELKAPAPLDRATLPAPDPEQAPAADAAVAAAYEEEPTSYLSPERKRNPALELVAASHGGSPFEEEATHIFFSTENGIGLPDVPDDEPTTIEPPSPLPIPAALGQPPAGPQPAPLGGAVRARARVAQKLLQLPAAGATGRHQPLTAAQANAAQANAGAAQAQLRAAAQAPLPEGDPFRVPSHAPSASSTQRAPLLWMAGALLLVLVTGVLVKTPIGIALGLRKPPDGIIEVRTEPEVPASVRLDGIYRGRAPLRLEGVPAGNRVLALEAEGYAPVSRLITLEGGATVRENISLNPQAKAASQLATP